MQGPYAPVDHGLLRTAPCDEGTTPPTPLRWDPLQFDASPRDFVDGLAIIATNGDAHAQIGVAVHVYAANRGMGRRYFSNADGELLRVPQAGTLALEPECGRLAIAPGSIAVIPRGLRGDMSRRFYWRG